MDQKFITNVVVACDCARTANVQITDPATTATYIGEKEVVIKGIDGTCYTSAANVTDKEEVLTIGTRKVGADYPVFVQPIYGGDIKSVYVIPYNAPVQETVKITGIDATLTNFTYIVRIVNTRGNDSKQIPTFKTAEYSVTTAQTAAQIVAGLAANINATFANDLNFPVTAKADGTSSDELVVTATAPEFSEGKYKYQQFRFTLECVGFTGTVSSNKGAALTVTGGTPSSYAAFTIGDGSVNEIKQLEWKAANNQYGNMTGRRVNAMYETTPIPLNTVTGETYDKLVINLEPTGGVSAESIKLPSTIVVPIAIGTGNQGDDLVAVINAYLTLWGIATISLT